MTMARYDITGSKINDAITMIKFLMNPLYDDVAEVVRESVLIDAEELIGSVCDDICYDNFEFDEDTEFGVVVAIEIEYYELVTFTFFDISGKVPVVSLDLDIVELNEENLTDLIIDYFEDEFIPVWDDLSTEEDEDEDLVFIDDDDDDDEELLMCTTNMLLEAKNHLEFNDVVKLDDNI